MNKYKTCTKTDGCLRKQVGNTRFSDLGLFTFEKVGGKIENCLHRQYFEVTNQYQRIDICMDCWGLRLLFLAL